MSDTDFKSALDRARELRLLAEHYWRLAMAPRTPLATRYHHMEIAEHLEAILVECESESSVLRH